VFVERFSAPGDPLVMSEGALDAKSAQYSVYNALPFRNLNVRNALKTLLTIPSTAGGYQSGSSTTASFHKVPKNGYSNIAGSTNNDNFWIQHPIPQCDLKYKWIFDSATATSSCDSYSFTSASSLAKTDGSQLLQPVVYTDSNFYVIDPINTASNLLGIDGGNISSYINSGNGYYSLSSPGAFSALITKRNAGYGYPSWLQIRTSNHPLARVFKENNILSTVEPKKTNITPFRGGAIQSVSVDTITNYTETPMAENYPVKYNFVIENYKNGVLQTSNTPLKISYSNVKEYFNNIELNDKYINSNDLPKLAYDQVQELIKTKDSYSPIKSVEGFSYKEKLFPRKVNAYRGIVRGRTSYEETQSQKDSQDVVARRTFWKDNITERLRSSGSLNSQGNLLKSTQFSANLAGYYTNIISASVNPLEYNSEIDTVSNDTYNFKNGELLTPGAVVRATEYSFNTSLLTASAQYIATVYYNNLDKLRNNTYVEAGINPWYNSYDDYAAELRAAAKDYSILPEFRISQHMPYFVAGDDFNFNSKELQDFLKIDGANLSSSTNADFYKVYSHTDFINNYATFESDLNSTDLSSGDKKIKVKISAAKKLLPYNGFYPSHRLLQIAQIFSSSFSGTTTGGGWMSQDQALSYFSGSGNDYATFFSAFFAPGVIFNTIKSGIAVDFPAHTGSVTTGNVFINEGVNKPADYRITFEAAVAPNKANLTTNYPIGLSSIYGTYASASWNGEKNNSLYELAINNFLGETTKFFLKGGNTQAFVSTAQSKYKQMSVGKTYYMDISLYKTPSDFIMYESYAGGSETLGKGGAYGAAYQSSASYDVDDPSFAPSTPPYFYGKSTVRLSFTPTQTRQYSPSEIIAGLTASYFNAANDNDGNLLTNPSPASSSIMRIDASVNFEKITTLKEIEYDRNGSIIKLIDKASNSGYDAWVISPKFETPIFNFSDKDSGYDRGMWINYKDNQGTDKEGIFLEISNPFPEQTFRFQKTTGSLIDVCGFDINNSAKKLGQIEETKEISEAIVAIPIDRNGNRYQIPADTFKLLQNPDLVNAAKPFNPKPSRTLIDMYETMQKYVFPPHLDFVNNNSVKPFGMYIFEFTHTLTKLDLGKIWQGVMPEIATKMELDEQSIEHSFGPGEIFDRNFDDQTRWIVFKVKRKAENNYFNAVAGASEDTRFDFQFQIGNQKVSAQKSILPYSYNWPYDFFSLVELAKIDAEVTYKKKE
jgi:hypothetical protein